MSPCDNDFVERLHPRRDTRARSVHSGPFLLVAIIAIVASLSTLGQLRRRLGPHRSQRFETSVYSEQYTPKTPSADRVLTFYKSRNATAHIQIREG